MFALHTISNINRVPLCPAVSLLLFAQCVVAQQAARPESVGCRSGPVASNVASPTAPPCNSQQAELHQPSKKEIKELTATAHSRDAYLKLADYYQKEADGLEAEAREYEHAAALCRVGPKNLIAPTTAAQYQRRAKEFRAEERSDRLLASSYAGNADAGPALAPQSRPPRQ